MPTAVAMLDNRKLSIVFWILAALAFCIVKRDIRASLIGVVKAAVAPRIALPLAGMIIYIGAIIAGLWAAGLWTLDSCSGSPVPVWSSSSSPTTACLLIRASFAGPRPARYR